MHSPASFVWAREQILNPCRVDSSDAALDDEQCRQLLPLSLLCPVGLVDKSTDLEPLPSGWMLHWTISSAISWCLLVFGVQSAPWFRPLRLSARLATRLAQAFGTRAKNSSPI
mmetsp:Transcript_112126/g.356327  ORF Transcript_112126/g.356327 Transcript_112126/m.356327 type:complete len:113 (-) Transcript_112126:68-406(-)